MNYPETLQYLYTRLPLFSRIGAAAMKKDLHNTIALCDHLGNPERKIKTIHVAGTNGKGSVSHMLAAVLQQAGYKTGLYTSPHLHDFRERIRINGQMMPERKVEDFVAGIIPEIDRLEPSFFELTVAMAFQHFAEEHVDIAVIETGLGGRLDSTNVILPEVSVITNIGFDHTDLLGDTLSKIAAEKAGIIKEIVPVVIGERHAETDPVFDATAKENNAAIFYAADHFSVVEYNSAPTHLEVELAEKDATEPLHLKLDLPGMYQLKNVQTALMAIRVLQQCGWKISEDQIASGLAQVQTLTGLMGRWEVLQTAPAVVLEVAHNAAGMQQVLHHVGQHRFGKLHFVLGMVKDKDIGAVLQLLPKGAAYYFTQAAIPRALPTAELQSKAAQNGLTGKEYPDVNTAIDAALQVASSNDLVLICGSVFLVGEVDRKRFRSSPR
ncbi:bifunctional folylpolyglutamate synthase/dihydrofolate synthase [Pseudocnuella soli]|uniref:bifunctional folylpolyglutamate synthase/dihydrofolate synthase n=1 Tax=Pseudocnuella soli TaxID=2502779 RepID=UPI0010509F81|nr:folylpolyglutamate synthase/dihydrofolate synthase family protein [Pseudocnuella soli]